MRVWGSGAAPLPLEIVEPFEKQFGGRIQEGYGLTEASPVVGVPGATMSAAAAGMASPAAAEVRARGQISDAEIDAIVARGIQLADERPVHAHVTLSVDGETLARATARANRSSMARSFVPVPVGG